jgi:general secretion pathway protein K
MTTGNRKGGALLTVLWVSAGLAAIAFSVATTVRSETGRVASSADGLRAWYLATGSVERAIQWMLWGNDSPQYWQPNKPRLSFSYASGDVVVEMIPESAKLNINTAGMEDLVRVATAVTGNVVQAQDIAAGIMDYRSGGGLNPALSPSTFMGPHASFKEIEELLLVRGMTPEFYYGNYISDTQGKLYPSGGLRDCLSVWGSYGPFDVNTMSPALMQATGVPAEGAQAIAARRQLAPFANLGEVGSLGYPTSRMIVGGGHVIWTIRATARLRRPDGLPSDVVRSASAVVKMLDQRVYTMMPIWIVRWYDDAWSEFSATPPGVLQ